MFVNVLKFSFGLDFTTLSETWPHRLTCCCVLCPVRCICLEAAVVFHQTNISDSLPGSVRLTSK